MGDHQSAGIEEDQIDEGILGVVLALREAGVATYSSCQGGGYQMGHGHLLPTVCFEGDEQEGQRAEKIATSAGYLVRQISRIWYSRDGVRYGPFWEMQFVMGAAARRP